MDEQQQLDLRQQQEKDLSAISTDAVRNAERKIRLQYGRRHCESKHEAYGIAAEAIASVTAAVKDAKKALDNLLQDLPLVNQSAAEMIHPIYTALETAARYTINAAARVAVAEDDVYSVEIDNRPIEAPDPQTNFWETAEDAEPDTDAGGGTPESTDAAASGDTVSNDGTDLGADTTGDGDAPADDSDAVESDDGDGDPEDDEPLEFEDIQDTTDTPEDEPEDDATPEDEPEDDATSDDGHGDAPPDYNDFDAFQDGDNGDLPPEYYEGW